MTGEPHGSGLSITTSTGVIQGIPNAIDAAQGSLSLSISASDGLESAEGPLTVMVSQSFPSATRPNLVMQLPTDKVRECRHGN